MSLNGKSERKNFDKKKPTAQVIQQRSHNTRMSILISVEFELQFYLASHPITKKSNITRILIIRNAAKIISPIGETNAENKKTNESLNRGSERQ